MWQLAPFLSWTPFNSSALLMKLVNSDEMMNEMNFIVNEKSNVMVFRFYPDKNSTYFILISNDLVVTWHVEKWKTYIALS